MHENKPDSLGWSPCLFALTGQSNISNTKNPLSLVHLAKSLGYHTLLDAAALAPTSSISLRDTPVDAMAISFYKMFGFPTGVGALVVKESFLKDLQRPWFAGGTVDVVQVPGTLVTMTESVREQFEVRETLHYATVFRSLTISLCATGRNDQLSQSTRSYTRTQIPINVHATPSSPIVGVNTSPCNRVV